MSLGRSETSTTAKRPAEFVNLERYPLTAPESPGYQQVVQQSRTRLLKRGLVALPGFLSPRGLRCFLQETEDLTPRAFHSAKQANPYGTPVSDDLAADHPARIQSPTDRHGLAYHDMRETAMEALYRWPNLQRFVADVLDLPRLYLHEDPSNAMVLQIYKPGGRLAWHFDRARFSTTLQLQKADAGGAFEAAPQIRNEDDENLTGVRELLLEEQTPPVQSRSEPGTFVIMFGRNCLHRVTEVIGETARISLILSYEEEPGVKLDVATRKLFFGPDAPDDPD